MKAVALRDLTELQARFVSLFIECGDPYRAALGAGYTENTAHNAGKDILNRPTVALAIARAARVRLARRVPLGLGTIEFLAEKATSEKVRLDAAKALLDRAGIVPPKAPEAPSSIEKPLHELSTDELRTMATRLDDELSDRAKTVMPDPDTDLIG